MIKISLKAEAIAALQNEADSVAQEQLAIGEEMSKLLARQCELAKRNAILAHTIGRLLKSEV